MIYALLPAYNEEKAIGRLLDRWLELAWGPDGLRILVVDDGSADGTAAVVTAHEATKRGMAELLPHGKNRGLAQAMRTGIAAVLERSTSDDDLMIAMDADDTHDPAYVPALMEATAGGADVAICSRFQKGGREIGVSVFRKALSRGVLLFMRAFTPMKDVKDFSCGFRAYRVSILRAAERRHGSRLIESEGFSCMAELLIKLYGLGAKVTEVPFTLRYDQKPGASKIRIGKTVLEYGRLVALAREHIKR